MVISLCLHKNFAKNLLGYLVPKEELIGRNVRGGKGKVPLDDDVINKIYTLTKMFYPKEFKINGWQHVVDALNEFCRRPDSKMRSIPY